jgi:hypothetical protein
MAKKNLWTTVSRASTKPTPTPPTPPSAPSPSPPPAKVEEAESIRPTASSPLLTPSTNLKDLRAFEHNRQRVKKAADVAKMRARKAAAVNPSRVIKSPRDCPLPSQKEKLLREEDVDALDGVFAPTLTLDGTKRRESLITPFEPVKREVKLEDLVVTPQKKAGRKTRGKLASVLASATLTFEYVDGDFEVVPHVRAVIVLDDNADVHDMDVDEAWEHVTLDNDDDEASSSSDGGEPVSYAKIAAAGRK